MTRHIRPRFNPAAPAGSLQAEAGDPAFNRLARLAARAAGAPFAVIWTGDPDHPTLLGHTDLPEGCASAQELLLSGTMYRAVAERGREVVVRGAQVDPAVGAIAAPAGCGILAYAAVPVKRSDGEILAALCVLDSARHDWQVDELTALREIAPLVATELDLRAMRSRLAQEQHDRQRLLERLDGAYYLLDHDGRIVEVNDEAARWFGRGREDLRGSLVWECWPRGIRPVFEPYLRQALAQDSAVEFEYHAEDTGRWLTLRLNPDGDGIGVLVRDVTQQKQAEAAARERADEFASLFDAVIEATLIEDEGIILAANQALAELLGYETCAVIGHRLDEFLLPDQGDSAPGALAQYTDGPHEIVLVRRDGARIPVEISRRAVRYGSRTCSLASLRDISERKRAAVKLRTSELLYRSLFVHNPLPVYLIDRDGVLQSVNPATEAITGVPADGLVGMSFMNSVAPAHHDRARKAFIQALNGVPQRVELTLKHSDGRSMQANVTALPIVVDGAVVGVFGISEDVTQPRQAEAELRFQKALLESQREASPDSILVVSSERTVVAFNRRFTELWGVPDPDIQGHPFSEMWQHLAVRLADPEGWLAYAQRFYQDPTLTGQGLLELADGRIVEWQTAPIADVDGTVHGRVWYHRDVTERVRGEAALREAEERYRTLVEQIPAVTYIDACGPEGRPAYISPQVEQLLGYSTERWLSESWFWRGTIHSEDHDRIVRAVEHAQEVVEPFSHEYRMIAADGRVIWVREDAIPVRNESGDPEYWQGILVDITERKRIEEELRRQALTFATISDGIIMIDTEGRITDWNPAAERMYGYRREEMLGQPIGVLHPTEDMEALTTHVRESIQRQGHWSAEKTALRKDGTVVVYESVVVPLQDAGGTTVAAIVVNHDITKRKELEEELLHQAFHDPLTSLPNRALLFDRITHALELAERHQQAAAVLFIDLDNFKVVNDSLGHEVGDQLLVAAAHRIRACLRPGDTVARLGGDEFAILLEDVAADDVPAQVAQRIIAAISQPFLLGRHNLSLSTSVGIAVADAASDGPQDFVRRADVALYRAKRLGKARYAVFDSSMNAEAIARLEMERDLRQAVELRSFTLAYQPIVELASGRITSVEALARWDHPRRGMILPSEFIPVAEEAGLILQIGQQVLEMACRQARHWQLRYPGVPLTLNVNLSARQFRHAGLVGDILQVLQDSGLPPQSLKLEITESLMMDEVEETLATIRELKALGIQIVIDDFGTGYSSLAYLKRFPVDALKIDRAFVAGLESNPEDRALVSAVIATARALHLTVTAEGVETSGQVEQLTALGCDCAQGFLFAEPGPPDAIDQLLREGRAPAGAVVRRTRPAQ